MKKFFFGLTAALLLVSPVLAAPNEPSGSPRVQGTPDGRGDPVQVTIVGADGSDVTATAVSGTVAISQVTPGTTNGTSVSYVGSTAVATGNGVVGTGVQRVAIASNNTAFNVLAVGSTVHGAAAVDNPVPVGGVFDNSYGLLDTGDVGRLRLDSRGNTRMTLYGTDSAFAAMANAAADGDTVSGSFPHALSISKTEVYNAATSTWYRQPGDGNGTPSTPGLSSTTWSYTNGATGILSNTTTAVTIKTAAGASVRNYIDSCQITTTAFGASVPIAIRDGAGGTVLWAGNVPTAGWLDPRPLVFAQPLRGTANTLLEVLTTTANTTGTAWVNCQGHTGP